MSARQILVTAGLRDDIPDVPGVRERWGRDLLHSPLGVLGGTPKRSNTP